MIDLFDENLSLDPITSIEAASGVAPLVAILLCTYNGERFLAEQLDSLEAQTHQNWVLVVSDDGSKDATVDILLKYQAKWPQGKMTIRNGPQKGFCQNFLSLACDPQIQAGYFAFCDQDDLWLPTKLAVALKNITKNQEANEPYVYCGRTIYVDENLRKVGCSQLFSFPRTFRNALIQSIAGGNTMVFNPKTKEYLEKAGPVNHPSHDWWLYQLVTAVGGVVSETFSPRIGLAMLPIMILCGLIILTIGQGRLSAANDIPTDEEDLQAMKDISNEVK